MKNRFQMVGIILIILTIFSFDANAQLKVSPFRPIPKPEKKVSISPYEIPSVNQTVTAFRFTPMAGYNITTKQVQAGVSYGIQWMHFVDSTQKYYTTFSINAVGWVNGSTTPDISSLTSYGITVGFLNQLIQGGVAYSPPTSSTKSSFGIIINFAVPLNN